MKTSFSLALAIALVLAVLSEISAHAATAKKGPASVAPARTGMSTASGGWIGVTFG